MTIEIALHWYAAGAAFMLAWMAIINDNAREVALVMLLWPLFLAIILTKLPFVLLERHAGLAVRLVRRRKEMSPWGTRRPSDGRCGFGLRCPWCELQVFKAHPNDGGRD
jgi:hypothetical protein